MRASTVDGLRNPGYPPSRQVDPRQPMRYPNSIHNTYTQYPQREGDPVLKAIRDEWQGDALYGLNSVLAAFSAKRREMYGLFYQEGKPCFSMALLCGSWGKA